MSMSRASKMAQQVKPDDWSLISRTHMVEREK